MAQPPQQPQHKPQPKTRPVQIEIPLTFKPKRLYGSDCPPPPAISLVPPRDSTAYILSKMVMPPPLPPNYDNKKYIEAPGIQRKLYYTIGWTDLPTAKVVVRATKILNYVSPRELEDFEYKEFLALEEERERVKNIPAATPPVKVKGKRGRPRKGPAAVELELVEEEEQVPATQEEVLRADKKAAEASLSTPSKRRLAELLEVKDSEAESGSENAAIHRQLYGTGVEKEDEGIYDTEIPYGDEMDIDSDIPVTRPSVSGGERDSSRASSLALLPVADPLSRPSPALSGRPKTKHTPIPIPQIPQPNRAQGSAMHSPSAGSGLQLVPSSEYYEQPPPKKAKKRKSEAEQPPNGTPSIAAPPEPSKKAMKKAASPNPIPISQPTNGTGTSTPQPDLHRRTSGFTPVHVRTPSSQPPPPSLPNPTITVAPDHPETSQPPKKKRKKAAPKPPPADDAWEVLRLEADKQDYDSSGNLTHLYKVRWVGDWPEDQNPTWEPENNISPELVAEYLKKKEAKTRNGHPNPAQSPAKSKAWMPKKRYSNVAEAFEGEVGELGDHNPSEVQDDGDGDDGEEQIVVSEEPPDIFPSFDRGVASYKHIYGGKR